MFWRPGKHGGAVFGTPVASGSIYLNSLSTQFIAASSQQCDATVAADFTFNTAGGDRAFSFTFWAYQDTGTVNNFRPCFKGSGITREITCYNSAGFVKFELYTDISNFIAIRGGAITLATWYNIALTYDGSGTWTGMNIYMNGSNTGAANSSSGTYVGMTATGHKFHIGEMQGQYHNGFVDEFAVWTKELTASEVTEVFNSGSPGNLAVHSAFSNLQNWWRMGDGDTFPVITDAQGNNNMDMINMTSTSFNSTVP